MAEITLQRLEQLRASARANRQETIEVLHNYDGAIQTLTMLIDDLRAQTIKEANDGNGAMTPDEFVDRLNAAGVTGPEGEPIQLVGVRTNEDVAGFVPEEK